MSRERLMQKQRERMEARRKRLKEAAQKSTTKSVKTVVTRDTSKDQSRKEIARLTGGKKPKTGNAAMEAISKFAGKQPAPKASKPAAAPKASKPAVTPKAKPAVSNNGKDRFFAGAKGGKYDTGSFFDGAKGGKYDKPSSTAKKPSRSDFPSGRAGASQYATALRVFNKTQVPTTKPKNNKYNRRGRSI